MRNCLSLLLITICPALSPFVSGQEEPSAKTDSPWISLFNGKDLKGWTPKIRGHQLGDNFGNTFRVEDGKIQVGFEKYGEFKERFGHLFYDEKFSNYIFRCEYRFIGKQCPGGPGWARRNSGARPRPWSSCGPRYGPCSSRSLHDHTSTTPLPDGSSAGRAGPRWARRRAGRRSRPSGP